MHRFVVAFCLVLVTGCSGDSPVTPSPINQEMTLAPGQTVAVTGSALSVTFIGVSGESRCPIGAIVYYRRQCHGPPGSGKHCRHTP